VGTLPVAEALTLQPGLDANSNPVNYYGGPNNNTGSIGYNSINVTDDFGFITMIYNENGVQ
jgi:hypothetical protein